MLTVILHRAGYASEEVHVSSIEEASVAIVAFQKKHALGASDCGPLHGAVYQGFCMPYVVSYNGRVWASAGSSRYDGLVYDPLKN